MAGRAGTAGKTWTPVELIGDKQLTAILESLPKAMARKIARKAVREGLKVIHKKMKSMIPSYFKGARRAIGYSLKKSFGGVSGGGKVMQGRVGAGVGRKRGDSKKSRSGKRGVGISSANIHWFVMGTKHMQPKWPNLAERALSASQKEATAATFKVMRMELIKRWKSGGLAIT